MSPEELINEIRRDLVSEGPVSPTLRKCLFLAQATSSEKLRQWATSELEGYRGPVSEIPVYRRITAPLRADGMFGNLRVTGQELPIGSFPAELREVLAEPILIVHPISEIEELAQTGSPSQITPGHLEELGALLTDPDQAQYVSSVYYSLTSPALRGIVDQVRTALTKLIAEMPLTDSATSEAVDRATDIAVTGKSNITVTGSNNTISIAESATTSEQAEPKRSILDRLNTPVGIVGTTSSLIGLAGSVSVWQGWL